MLEIERDHAQTFVRPVLHVVEHSVDNCCRLKGTMNALFLKDLAEKTHRGLRGRVEDGKSAGGLCCGYRVVKTLSGGSLTTGEREIEPARTT